jgi:hypothetical protein
MSMWRRLLDALSRPAAEAPAPAPPPPPPPPPRSASPDEQYLRTLLGAAGHADAEPALPVASEPRPSGEVGDREFWAAVGRLIASGRERTAIELLGRFVALRPRDEELAMRLAELLCERHDDAAARPILERLLASDAHSRRARFLCAELAERAGDEETARRHLETLLAADLDYPRARAKVAALRPSRDRTVEAAAAGHAAPTLAGLPGSGELAGRYRLLREIGRGASGAVYVAHDDELDRELALKILHPHARAEARAAARARAWSEARLAAAIRHPGVVAIYDLDEERGLFAMELCTGGPLRAALERGPLPVGEALARAGELFTTLEAVHRRGVVHGDLKPGNLLFRDAGGALVLGDFGLARLGGDARAGAGHGTLAYMAPELRRGGADDAAAPQAIDAYAAGVLLVELLAGSTALAGWLGDRAALLRGEARWDGALPPSVRAALGDGSERLRALAAALLDEDPARRPTAADAWAVVKELA